MKTIAAYAYYTGAVGLKRLSCLVERGFGLFGLHRSPSGVRVSDAARSRRETQVARLDEQGVPKLRIARYLARWLGWAALAGASTTAHSISSFSSSCQVNGTMATFSNNNLTNYTFNLGNSQSKDYSC
jgi:hypothetical protein